MSEDLQASQSVVGSLQSQLEIVEEKLAKSELMLLDHEKNVMKERRRAEEVEQNMMVRTSLIPCLFCFLPAVFRIG